jgi:hypothetical protein
MLTSSARKWDGILSATTSERCSHRKTDPVDLMSGLRAMP